MCTLFICLTATKRQPRPTPFFRRAKVAETAFDNNSVSRSDESVNRESDEGEKRLSISAPVGVESAQGEDERMALAEENNAFARDKYFERQMDKWDRLPDGSYIKVGDILKESALHKVGIPDGGLYFDVSKIQK